MIASKLLKTEVTRHVSLGAHVLDKLGEVADELQLGTKGLILVGPMTGDNDPVELANEVMSYLAPERQVTVIHLSGEDGWVDLEPVVARVKELAPEFVVALGEGEGVDRTKYVVQQVGDPLLEWVSIPTAPTHDGFASPFIFLDLGGSGEEYYGLARPPIAILADSALVARSSTRTIRSGLGDLLSKYTAVWDWKLASRLRGEPISDFAALVADELVELQASNLTGSSINPHNPESVSVVLKGLIISGFLGSFSSSLRSIYGSEHMFADALDHIAPGKTLHGERVALGTVMMASLQGQDWRKIRGHLKAAGVPVTAKELGLRSSTIVKALLSAVNYPRDQHFYTILGEQGLSEDAAFRLMYRTGIIGSRPGIG